MKPLDNARLRRIVRIGWIVAAIGYAAFGLTVKISLRHIGDGLFDRWSVLVKLSALSIVVGLGLVVAARLRIRPFDVWVLLDIFWLGIAVALAYGLFVPGALL